MNASISLLFKRYYLVYISLFFYGYVNGQSITPTPNYISSSDQTKIDSIYHSIVLNNSWLDSLFLTSKNTFRPKYPNLFLDFNSETADSLIRICEQITYHLYGQRDIIKDKCKIKNRLGLSKDEEVEIIRHNDAFSFLYLLWNDCNDYDVSEYGSIVCNNPLNAIEWYKANRQNFNTRIFQYIELIKAARELNIESRDIDMGLIYNDVDNRIVSARTKFMELLFLIDRLISENADEATTDSLMMWKIYEEPFFDLKADLYGDSY